MGGEKSVQKRANFVNVITVPWELKYLGQIDVLRGFKFSIVAEIWLTHSLLVVANSAETFSDSVVMQQTFVVGLTEHKTIAGLESASIRFARTTLVREGGVRADVDMKSVPPQTVAGSGTGGVESQRPALHLRG